ncbi:hypothetical protein [Pseudobutyrivibrio xylanivorans]|uniref:hypothetical protein n=1 Tax=Pseudobutyrivibrio xylanivorans TaxID=185007 RepID=UPI0015A1821D|nr:hypothetical protein [Pseudobutyrivibrio xylanivorans]
MANNISEISSFRNPDPISIGINGNHSKILVPTNDTIPTKKAIRDICFTFISKKELNAIPDFIYINIVSNEVRSMGLEFDSITIP